MLFISFINANPVPFYQMDILQSVRQGCSVCLTQIVLFCVLPVIIDKILLTVCHRFSADVSFNACDSMADFAKSELLLKVGPALLELKRFLCDYNQF